MSDSVEINATMRVLERHLEARRVDILLLRRPSLLARLRTAWVYVVTGKATFLGEQTVRLDP